MMSQPLNESLLVEYRGGCTSERKAEDKLSQILYKTYEHTSVT